MLTQTSGHVSQPPSPTGDQGNLIPRLRGKFSNVQETLETDENMMVLLSAAMHNGSSLLETLAHDSIFTWQKAHAGTIYRRYTQDLINGRLTKPNKVQAKTS
ncbi:unnamed protein product [Ectocarpus sp. 12 AP-2014]